MKNSKRNVLVFALFAMIALLVVGGFTKPDDSKRLLSAQGLRNVKITGYNFFGCSEDDIFRTGFEATGVNGSIVKGTVCSGLFFKDATIRYK